MTRFSFLLLLFYRRDFEGNRPDVASKPEKFSGLAGATVTGVQQVGLRKSQVKVLHFLGISPRGWSGPSRDE